MARYFTNKKNTVNDYRSIRISRFRRDGLLIHDSNQWNIRWTNRLGEEPRSIDFTFEIDYGSPLSGRMTLSYGYKDRSTHVSEAVSQHIWLQTTVCNFGGHRWWFLCPFPTAEGECQRRVGVLYLSGKHVGCRQCFNLTYSSCQDSHKVDFLERYG